jgi:hypothetical protein
MKVTTHSMEREASRRIRFLSERVLPTLPTFYFLQDATILHLDRLM